MRKYIILLFFLLPFLTVKPQSPFSDSVVVSILTCSPGQAVYAKFGHTALRFYDPATKNDVVFNYGLFDFDTDNFILKFIKGYTYYQLGADNTANFLNQYKARNSSVTEQILNLTSDERRRITALIMENYEPENRTYLYNFVLDNCATRPFYKIAETVDGQVFIDTLAVQHTFRQWVERYAGSDKWLMFGIDLIFGCDADKLCTPHQSLFLPEVLMEHLNGAKITDMSGERKLVGSILQPVLKNTENTPLSSSGLSPVAVNLLILTAMALFTVLFVKAKKGLNIIIFILLFLSGIFGLLLAYLMFISIHPLVHYNFNILWLNPLNLLTAFLLFSKKAKKIMRYYVAVAMLMLPVLAIIAICKVQHFNPAEYPLWILFGFSYFFYLKVSLSNK